MSDAPSENDLPPAGRFLRGMGEVLGFILAVGRAVAQFATGRWPPPRRSPDGDDGQPDAGDAPDRPADET